MKAVQTNGEGERTTAHLNLSTTLADVWGASISGAVRIAPRKAKQEPNRHLPAYPNRFAAKRRMVTR